MGLINQVFNFDSFFITYNIRRKWVALVLAPLCYFEENRNFEVPLI